MGRAAIALSLLCLLADNSLQAEETNRQEVREQLSSNGWSVAYGDMFTESDWGAAAKAVFDSYVAGNPGPFIQWMSQELDASYQKIARDFEELSREEFLNMVRDSIEGKKIAIFKGVEVDAGIATYKRWEKIALDLPVGVEFRGLRSKVRIERIDRTISYPNWHQPYVRYRPRKVNASTVVDNDGILDAYLEVRQGRSGNESQRWRLETVDVDFTLLINKRQSRVARANMVLDYRDGDLCYIEKQAGETGNRAQRWALKEAGDGTFLIENMRLSLSRGEPYVLDYTDGNVCYLERQRGPTGNEAQRWRIVDAEDEHMLIENVRLSRTANQSMVLDWKK